MSAHPIPARLDSFLAWMRVLAIAGGAALLVGLWSAPERAWADLLLASYALVCLGLAGIFFVALQYVSGAVWSIPLRRVGEAMSSAIPIGGIGILILLIARPSIYHWYGHAVVSAEGWTGFKNTWLSYPFFLTRAFVYLAVWMWFSWAIRRNSRRQDREGGTELSKKNARLSAAFMVAFGVTFWLASTDWVMSLQPDWASTIFGIYNFAGMFVSGLATITLVTLGLRRAGPLRHGVGDAQFLDLGRLMVAFATFWTYIWFSQFMLIWYANLTEETTYFVRRTNFGWGWLVVLNLFLNWGIPFLLLLPRVNKANPRTLIVASTILLLGRTTDLYLGIMPSFSRQNPRPTIWDLAALALIVGAFSLTTMRSFFASEPVPVGDPLLSASAHSH